MHAKDSFFGKKKAPVKDQGVVKSAFSATKRQTPVSQEKQQQQQQTVALTRGWF